MDKIAFGHTNALMRLAKHGLSNRQARAAMEQCPIAGRFSGEPFYYLDDIDAMAEACLDTLTIDDCGGD